MLVSLSEQFCKKNDVSRYTISHICDFLLYLPFWFIVFIFEKKKKRVCAMFSRFLWGKEEGGRGYGGHTIAGWEWRVYYQNGRIISKRTCWDFGGMVVIELISCYYFQPLCVVQWIHQHLVSFSWIFVFFLPPSCWQLGQNSRSQWHFLWSCRTDFSTHRLHGEI